MAAPHAGVTAEQPMPTEARLLRKDDPTETGSVRGSLPGDTQGNKLPRINTSSCAPLSSRTQLAPRCLMDLLTKWIQG